MAKDDFPDDNIDGEDEFDFDSLDSELDSDDGDDTNLSGDKPTGKRKPIVKFDAKAAVKDAVSVETLQQIGDKIGSEFSGIGKAYKATIGTLSEVDQFKRSLMKDIAPTISQTKRVTRLYLPKLEKMLPEKLYNKLSDLVTDQGGYNPQSEEQVRSAAISASLAEVFEAQQDIARDQYVRNQADGLIKMKVQAGQHQESTTVLFQIRNLVKANQIFFEGTFKKYLMKSLELKYKMLFLTKDLLEKSTAQTNILESKLEAIKLNTGLPDVVKRFKSEEFRQSMRERVYGKATTSIDEWTAGFRKNLFKNLKTNFVDKISESFNEIVGGIAEGAEAVEENRQLDAEMGVKSKSPITKLTTFLVKKLLIDTGVVAMKAGVGKQQFKDIDTTISDFTDQLPYKLKELAETRDDFLGDVLKMVIPERDKPVLENLLEKRGTDEVPFDVITRKSIIEIIPGFLAKIHQQASITSKALSFYIKTKLPDSTRKSFDKVTDIEELVFDRASEDFIGASEFKNKVLEKMFGSQEDRTSNMKDLIATMSAGYSRRSDDGGFEKALPAIVRFLSNLSKHDQVVNPSRILKYLKGDELTEVESRYLDMVMEDIPEDARGELADVLSKIFFKDIDKGEYDKNVKKDIGRLLRQLARDNDEYGSKVNEINAYGGKRHLKGLIHAESEADLAPEIDRIRRQYIAKYGEKKFAKDEYAQASFKRDIASLRRRSGLDRTAIRDIQSDVSHEDLLKSASENREYINKNWDKRDADRETVDKSTVSERVSEGVNDLFKSYVKPFKEALSKISPSKPPPVPGYEPKPGAYSDAKERAGKAYEEAKKSASEAYDDAKSKVKDFVSDITKKQADDISEDTGVPNRDEAQISGPGIYFQGSKRELHIPLDGIIGAIKNKLGGKRGTDDANNKSSESSDQKSQTDILLTEIKDLLKGQFTTTNDLDTTKVHIANQILATLARMEIGSGGDPSSKRQMSTMSRIFGIPGSILKGAGSIASKATRSYINASMSFYKGLFGITKRIVPGVLGIVPTIGKGIVGVNRLGGKALSGIGSLFGFGKKDAGEKVTKDKESGLIQTLVGGYFKLLGATITGSFGLGKKLTGMGLGSIAKMFTPTEEFVDVYLKDKVDLGQPLMKGADIRAGKYVYGDGTVLTSSRKINGPIFDAETKQLVVSSDDLKHGLVDYKNEPLSKSSIGGLGYVLAKKAVIGYAKFLKGTAELGIKAISATFGGIGDILFGRRDKKNKTSVSDEITTNLEKLVQLVTEIKDAVKPKTIREGSYEDYLRDRSAGGGTTPGAPGTKPGKNRAKNAAKASALAALAAATARGEGGEGGEGGESKDGENKDSLVGTAAKYILGATGATAAGKFALDKVKGMFGFGKKDANVSDAASSVKPPPIPGAENAAKAAQATSEAVKKPGFFGKIANVGKAAASKVSSISSGAVDLAKSGVGKLSQSGIGKLATSRLGKMAGMSVGKKLAMAGAGVAAGAAGVLSAPAVATALTVAGLASTGYEVYDWVRGSKRRKMLSEVRNEAYHIPTEYLDEIIDFEDTIADIMEGDGENLTEKQAREYMKDFGLDPKSQQHYEYFRYWYIQSFLPIFQLSADLFTNHFGVSFKDQADLTNDQLTEYQAALNESEIFQQLKQGGVGLTVAEANQHDISEVTNTTQKKTTSAVKLPAAIDPSKDANVKTKTFLQRSKDALTNVKDSVVSGVSEVGDIASSAVSYVKTTASNAVDRVTGNYTPSTTSTKAPKDWNGPYGNPYSKYNALANQAVYNTSAIETHGGTAKDRPGSQYRGEFQIGYAMQKEIGLSSSDMRDKELVRSKVVNHYEKIAAQLDKDGLPVTEASLYAAWQQGYGGYKAIYKAAQTGGEVSPAIRRNMDANRPHGPGGKLHAGASPSEWLAGWENNSVASLKGSQSNMLSKNVVATTTPSPTPQTMSATTPYAPVEKAMGAWNGVERTTQSNNVVASPSVNDDKQVALLSEQNRLLKEMTNLLGGINKNTESDPNAKPDDGKLVAKLDSLINTLSGSMAGSSKQMTASAAPTRKVSPSSGGIDFSRQAMAS